MKLPASWLMRAHWGQISVDPVFSPTQKYLAEIFWLILSFSGSSHLDGLPGFQFCACLSFQTYPEKRTFSNQEPVSVTAEALFNRFYGCDFVVKKLWRGWQKRFFPLTSRPSGKLRPFFVNQTSFMRSEVFFYGENDEVNGTGFEK